MAGKKTTKIKYTTASSLKSNKSKSEASLSHTRPKKNKGEQRKNKKLTSKQFKFLFGGLKKINVESLKAASTLEHPNEYPWIDFT